MTPNPHMHRLACGSVGATPRPIGVLAQCRHHKWFIWFPRECAYLSSEHVRERGVKPRVIASSLAPRWA